MRDLVEMAVSTDPNLSKEEREKEFCSLLIGEFSKMRGEELAPHLAKFEFDKSLPGTILVFHFPIHPDVSKAFVGNGE